jgi:hypothetical protein
MIHPSLYILKSYTPDMIVNNEICEEGYGIF